jgi:hypothetical protein
MTPLKSCLKGLRNNKKAKCFTKSIFWMYGNSLLCGLALGIFMALLLSRITIVDEFNERVKNDTIKINSNSSGFPKSIT